jgi:PhnB protein
MGKLCFTDCLIIDYCFAREISMTGVEAVPTGYRTLTPHLVIKNATEAIEFYKKAFGAEQVRCMMTPDNKVMHACLKIGDSMLMLAEEMPNMGCKGPDMTSGSPVTVHVYVTDADSVFDRAVKAGAQVLMPLTNMFWGDRYGRLVDPYGHHWSVASKVEDLTEEEMMKRQQAFCAKMAGAAKA